MKSTDNMSDKDIEIVKETDRIMSKIKQDSYHDSHITFIIGGSNGLHQKYYNAATTPYHSAK